MDPQDTIDFSREALIMVGIVGGPILVAGLVIGLLIGIFQAMTQIQDQTVSAVPKILGMLLVTMLVLPWISERMVDYTRQTLATPLIGGRTAPVNTAQRTAAVATPATAQANSPFSLASSSSRLPDFRGFKPDRFAAKPMPVAPPLKRPASMPVMSPQWSPQSGSAMPVHPYRTQPTSGDSSMPQFRGNTRQPANPVDLEG